MSKNLEAPRLKSERSSEFETYLKERNRRTSTALSAIEKPVRKQRSIGVVRSRTESRTISRHKKPEHFVNVMSLADFQVSLERAASVLEHQNKGAFRIVPSEQDT